MTDLEKQQNDINELIRQFEAMNNAERNRPPRPVEPLEPPKPSNSGRKRRAENTTQPAEKSPKHRAKKKAKKDRQKPVRQEAPREERAEATKNKKQTHSPFAKLCNAITAVILVVVLIFVSGFTLFTESKTFSEDENRNLAQKPKFSMSAIASG
ncbi:MAG: hypothetical protein IJ077_04670 [Eubacterium sp.]|nr:hypothetical protein [Eubacterium sp.]